MHLTLANRRVALFVLIAWVSASLHADAQSTVRGEQEFARAAHRFALVVTAVTADASAQRDAIESMARALAGWDRDLSDLEKASAPLGAAEGRLALCRAYARRSRLESALHECSEAVRADPRRAEAYTVSALVRLAAGQSADAIAALTRASELEPDNPAPYYRLARLHGSLGHDAQARAALQAFRERAKQQAVVSNREAASPRFEELHVLPREDDGVARFAPASLAEGFGLLGMGRYEEAIAWFRQAFAGANVATAPAAADQELALGRAAIRQGDMSSALRNLADAVSRAPARADTRRALAAVLFADGQVDRSIQEFKAAVGADPADERSWAALADVFATIGLFDQAEQALQRASQQIQGSGQLHFSLGRLNQSLGKYPEAAREFETALELHPITGEAALIELLTSVYSALAAFDRVGETWTRRVARHLDDATAHRKLGEALLKQDRDEEALGEYWCALWIDPRTAEAHAAVAWLNLRSGQYADAAEAASRALAIDPSLKDTRYIHATALMRLGRAKEAGDELKEFQRVQAQAMSNDAKKSTLERLKRDASVSLANADHEKAAAILRDAAAFEPNGASIFIALGFALMAAGHHDEAVLNLQKSLQLDPTPDAHRYLAESLKALGRLDESRSEAERYRESMQQLKRQRLAQIAEPN